MTSGTTTGAFAARGGADDSFVRGDGEFFLHALAEFHGDAMAENVGGFVVKQNAENLVVDQALGEFGGAAQNFFDG